MAYIDYEYYQSLYGETISELEFNRLLWDAEREIDKMTSGIDNIKKLKVAFPTEPEDVEAVKRCIVDVVNFLHKLEIAESNADSVSQLIERCDGSLQGKVISSVSAGNESISFAVGKSTDTALGNAVKGFKSKEEVICQLISSKLRGIADANGVNLLYSGIYP